MKVWGMAFGTVSAIAALPIGVIAGAIKAADGGSFAKGADEIIDPIFKIASEFGDKYNDDINKAIIAAGISFMFGKSG